MGKVGAKPGGKDHGASMSIGQAKSKSKATAGSEKQGVKTTAGKKGGGKKGGFMGGGK